MKYIKLFEDVFEDNLQDFCEQYLAYLLDDGFKVRIIVRDWMITEIAIFKHDFRYGGNPFDWNLVKDYIIPFLEILSRKYNTNKEIVFSTKSKIHKGTGLVTMSSRQNIKSVIEDSLIDPKPSIDFRNIIKIVVNIKTQC